MSLPASDLWTRLLDQARRELPNQVIQTWLEPSEALKVEGNTLFIGVPDRFAADWNESKHAQLLASMAPVALGHPLNVVFRVHEERKTRSQMDLFVAPPPLMRTGSQQRPVTSAPLSDRYTFDQFVIGKSNELAAAAAQAVAAAPGRVYNPLFIYGDTGIGKTHLMQAVAHEILLHTPDTRIAFVGT